MAVSLQKTLDYKSLKAFGCNCFPWLKPYTSSKLDPKSKLCIFLRYNLNHKGYLCLHPFTHRLYVSRHVIFDESTFPLHTLPSSPSKYVPSPINHSLIPSSLTFITFTPHTVSPRNSINTAFCFFISLSFYIQFCINSIGSCPFINLCSSFQFPLITTCITYQSSPHANKIQVWNF